MKVEGRTSHRSARWLALALVGACAPVEPPASVASSPSDLERRVADLEAEREALARELASARDDLATERGRRFEREQQWLATLERIAELDATLAGGAGFEVELPTVAAPPAPAEAASAGGEPPRQSPEPTSDELAARARRTALRNLIAVEEVRGLDLLEVGALGDGFTGPVVFRLLDAGGRLAGSLFAERMRLEGSRASKSVTIVLEQGFESRSGERIPFERDVRRIELPHCDPQRWVEALPELFGPKVGDGLRDDGSRDLAALRRALNELFAGDAAHGYWRLEDLGGVVGCELRGVHLAYVDAQGKLERRLFADRMIVEPAGDAVRLTLEQGAQVRGDEKAPFLDGRYRIFLPRASLASWRKAEIPMCEPPAEASGTPGGAPASGRDG